MLNLVPYFEKIVNIALNDIEETQRHTVAAQDAIEQYLGEIRFTLLRYDHHQGIEIPDESLISRFFYETSILHIATHLLRSLIEEEQSSKNFVWPIEISSIYSWYNFHYSNCQNYVDELSEVLKNLEAPQLAIIDTCDRLLSNTSERFIGEFYTPLNIVEHLIDISQFDPAELLAGKKIVDPACGGGMILVSIAFRTITYAKKNNFAKENIIEALTKNVFGYDIQPFAVTLCNTALLSIIYPLLDNTHSVCQFENLEILDPLTQHKRFWNNQIFDYVIGNPPFMSVKKAQIDYIEAYEDVIYGHPNLYILFLWWSVKSVKKDGVVSLLLPQSMLVGQYYKSLRERLQETTRLLKITRMIDRKGVVGDADQQMMAISLKVGPTNDACNLVSLRVTRNGTSIANSIPLFIPDSKIIQNVNSATIWIVSENILDYEIEECVQNTGKYLGSYSDMFTIGNGGYVWNQNKSLLSPIQKDGYIPLVSAASISTFEFRFPYNGSHPTKYRAYSKDVEELTTNIRNGPSILIQRTTPRKVGRRLVCSIPNASFYQKHGRYFLENHVNFVASESQTLPQLYGLLGWLNSDLINFIFQLRNGTTQVSVYELHLIPVQLDIFDLIAPISKAASKADDAGVRNKHIKELNEVIFEVLKFTETQKKRIESVLSRKEKIPATLDL